MGQEREQMVGAGEPMVGALERDQLVADRARPLPRAILGRHAGIALWALRVFTLVVGAMVIWTFIAQLNG